MDECSNLIYDETGNMGQSESRGSRGGAGAAAGRGAAMSFGFRRRGRAPRQEGAADRRPGDNNGNSAHGSTEELFVGEAKGEPVTGRSTPLARPRKEAKGQPLRTNRFGFRQPGVLGKTSKVGDVTSDMTSERISQTPGDKFEPKNNNYINGSKPINNISFATMGPQRQPQKQTTKTVILTYAARQQPQGGWQAPGARGEGWGQGGTPRSVSASRVPHYRVAEAKSAKQVANNTTKISGCGEMAWEGGWGPGRAPRALSACGRARPRDELQLSPTDLQIMDEAIVTDVEVIPLPKLPSMFSADRQLGQSYRERPDPTAHLQASIDRFTRLQEQLARAEGRPPPRTVVVRAQQQQHSHSNDREEKGSRDGIQQEKKDKKKAEDLVVHKTTSKDLRLPLLSSRNDHPAVSTHSTSNQSDNVGQSVLTSRAPAAGEAMAWRSHDEDNSFGLSLSSSYDEEKCLRGRMVTSTGAANMVASSNTAPSVPVLASPATRPTALQLQTMRDLISSCTSLVSDDRDPQAALAALAAAASQQSLIADETSPADSLLSSSCSADLREELEQEEEQGDAEEVLGDATPSSSAYHTADRGTQEQAAQQTAEKTDVRESDKKEKYNNRSPDTPSNGSHSHSLSLSEGRDFLIDDEIADQPALIFEGNSIAEPPTSSLQLLERLDTSTLPGATTTITTPAMPTPQPQQEVLVPRRSPSLDTLSPCDSIASDDLIMDMELQLSMTSLNSGDEYFDRRDGSRRSGMSAAEDAELREELMKYSIRRQAARAHAAQAAHAAHATSGHATQTSYAGRARSGSGTPRSQPTTPAKKITDSLNTSTNGSGRLLERGRTGGAGGQPPPPPPPDPALANPTVHQDIVTIKTMLLKLKRVLQEPNGEHYMTRTETLNPLESQRDCVAPADGSSPSGEASAASEAAELRRQLLFLQAELEERERTVKRLTQQMCRMAAGGQGKADTACSNAATQTERLRPEYSTSSSTTLQGLSPSTHPGLGLPELNRVSGE